MTVGRLGLGLGGALLLLVLVALVLVVSDVPRAPSADARSTPWFGPGPYAVRERDLVLVDEARPTRANGSFPGAPNRTLPATIWYSTDGPERRPLVIYSHGYLSFRDNGSDLAEALASRGYVVAAVDFPLSRSGAPGGSTTADVAAQARDVAFLIDAVLNRAVAGTVPGTIDPARIGAVGLSLGAVTTIVATFHPTLRDPRIAAAVSIAGASAVFTDGFFATVDTPLLFIAGTADAIVDYPANAAGLPERGTRFGLLSIAGGSHTGFAPAAEPWMRLLDNPDRVGCLAVTRARRPDADGSRYGLDDTTLVRNAALPAACRSVAPVAMHAGRQLMITRAAVVSFFEAHFNPDAAVRAVARAVLVDAIPRDFEEARFSGYPALPQGE